MEVIIFNNYYCSFIGTGVIVHTKDCDQEVQEKNDDKKEPQ